MYRTKGNTKSILLAAGSLVTVSVLAMAVFGTMAGALHITGIQSAFAQSGNMTTPTGNQTAGGNMTSTGNQTSSGQGGDMAQGDPDGDGL